jgi:hypothetical protein
MQLSGFVQLLRLLVKFVRQVRFLFAVNALICKACHAGKRYSAVTPVIFQDCQTGKQLSAVTPVSCKVC